MLDSYAKGPWFESWSSPSTFALFSIIDLEYLGGKFEMELEMVSTSLVKIALF